MIARKNSDRKISRGLFKQVRRKRVAIDDAFIDRLNNAPNAYHSLLNFFASRCASYENIARDKTLPRPTNKLATQLLDELDFVQKRVKRLDEVAEDRFSILLEAMRFAARDRDLYFTLTLLPTIDEKRRVARAQAKSGKEVARGRQNTITSEQYNSAVAMSKKANGQVSRKRLATNLKISLPTLRKIEARLKK